MSDHSKRWILDHQINRAEKAEARIEELEGQLKRAAKDRRVRAERINELEAALRQHLAEDVIAKADRIDELEGALEWMVHESAKMRSRSRLDHDSAVDAERWALDLLRDDARDNKGAKNK